MICANLWSIHCRWGRFECHVMMDCLNRPRSRHFGLSPTVLVPSGKPDTSVRIDVDWLRLSRIGEDWSKIVNELADWWRCEKEVYSLGDQPEWIWIDNWLTSDWPSGWLSEELVDLVLGYERDWSSDWHRIDIGLTLDWPSGRGVAMNWMKTFVWLP